MYLLISLFVGSLSQVTSATSTLPAGLDYNSYSVSIYNYVYDTYLSSSYISGSVTVTPALSSNITQVLSSQVTSSLSSGNVDGVVQALNTIASTVGKVNCTNAPQKYCTSINRNICQSLPNTCGSCLSGFAGIVGSSNVPCLNLTKAATTISSTGTTVIAGTVGASCSSDSQCVFGFCNKGVCSIPNKACPTSDSSTICSGGGTCEYFDSSNTQAANCTVVDSNCVAKCICYSGYSGVDCSLTSQLASSRDSLRGSLCEGNIF